MTDTITEQAEPELKEIWRRRRLAWADLLRTDRFKQGRGSFIQHADGPDGPGDGGLLHCCLAVATVKAIEDGLDGVRVEEDGDVLIFVPEEEREDVEDDELVWRDDHTTTWIIYGDGDLPRSVRDWYGLDRDDPHIGGTENHHRAIHRNDVLEESFEEIADAIERDAEGL